jgi:hypothetical protein
MNFDDRELEDIARGLHQEWDSPSLWPRIQAELKAEHTVRPPAIRFWTLAGAVAATLLLSVGLALLVPERAASDAAADFLTREAFRDVRRSEAAYARSIDKLSSLAAPSMDTSSSPLAAAYREKLLILDSAIAELKANMDSNPYNSYLRTQLTALYRDKQETLEEWLQHAKDN